MKAFASRPIFGSESSALPEIVDPIVEFVVCSSAPTDAEIAAAYKKDAAKYAASEKRGLQLVQAISQ